MKRTLVYKSIRMAPDPSGEKGEIAYDMETVREHTLDVTPARLLLCRSWMANFFIALMAVLIVFALVYGLLVIGMKIDMGAGSAGRFLFGLAAALSFLALFVGLGTPAAIKTLKQDLVVRERGKGAWKLIDEKGWAMFVKMRNMEKERQKKEEEFRSVQ
ncbi:MAG: hypothetical protein JXA07_01735 [Spirochaetes bacterium]|nr:hypothetical protein [Spirochaetota bacterium]